MSELERRDIDILRAVLFVDGAIFLLAALLNFGAKVPLGFAVANFPVPIWQAGVGEAVIGVTLLAAAVSGRMALAWTAFWLSVGGILFGLSSAKIQGPARDIHIILVPLAAVVFGLLLWLRQQRLRLRGQA
jgi:hypothetical protein